MPEVFNPSENKVTATVITQAPPPPLKHVCITMPWDVAVTLHSVIRNVAGESGGYRGDMDQVLQVLRENKIPHDPSREHSYDQQYRGSIHLTSR